MAETSTSTSTSDPASPFPLPRVTIRFCTQCKWMLRAAYFAQELLSTFSTSLGEVALQPSTGGTFVVEIYYRAPPSTSSSTSDPSTQSQPQPQPQVQQRVLWDRKTDGGFPETKELKRRVRDAIEPGRDLGHVDRDHHRSSSSNPNPNPNPSVSKQPPATGADTRHQAKKEGEEEGRAGSRVGEAENAPALNAHPEENIGGPACRPGAESARTNAVTMGEGPGEGECEDCK